MSSTPTQQQQGIKDKTIYIYDPETNQIIPYKPDYSGGGIPLIASTTKTLEAVTQKPSARAAPKKDAQLGVIVPLIKPQPNQSDWVQLATFARKYPLINTIAIISPMRDERGIGNLEVGPDPVYQNAIATLQANGVAVVGYVNISADVNKTIDDKKRELDRWRNWYPEVNGVFFDKVNPDKLEECGVLAGYAKVDKAFNFVIADLASGYDGGVVNRADDFMANVPELATGVDIFVLYNREGYPADGWYNSIRRPWMNQYNRSKFAFIVYRVESETNTARSFIDKVVGIEKLAGYVYIKPSHEIDRRPLREWTSISTILEITLEQLNRMAQQEGMPYVKGVAADTTKPLITDASTESDTVSAIPQDIGVDKFGVRMVYPPPTRTAKQEWYLFEDNPQVDQSIQSSLIDTYSFSKQPDGSFRMEPLTSKKVKGKWKKVKPKKGPIRLEVSSPSKSKYLNVEMTGYFKVSKLPTKKTGRNNVISLIARSSRVGSGYKSLLMKDGIVGVQKEIDGVATGLRGTTQGTTNDLLNRWIGMKTMIYNYPKVDKNTGVEELCVGLEIWVDDNATDVREGGKLVIKNDWQRMMTMFDEGGWGTNAKKKQEITDKILTDTGDVIAWEFGEGAIVDFKYLSVREIDGKRSDESEERDLG